MTRFDRRAALQLAAIAALLPTCVSRAAHAASVPAFLPPSRPMLYTRRLRRTMADGSAFEVSRSFSVRFVPAPQGYHVQGEQVDVSVSAPARLARFSLSAPGAKRRSSR